MKARGLKDADGKRRACECQRTHEKHPRLIKETRQRNKRNALEMVDLSEEEEASEDGSAEDEDIQEALEDGSAEDEEPVGNATTAVD